MATFEHGTLTGAKYHTCGCLPCRAEAARYEDRRRRLIAYGRWQPLVDAEPVRRHINMLRAAGLGPKRIAALTGVSQPTIVAIIYSIQGRPPARRVRSETAAAVLALRADLTALHPLALTDGAGTRRRGQALCCLGWSFAAQAERLSRLPSSYRVTMTQQRVTVGTALAVRALFSELSMTPAPPGISASRARRHAERNGWLPPLAWDDELLDVPDADLNAEIARLVAAMDHDELRRCHTAKRRHGDRSPLILAGAAAYNRSLLTAGAA